MNFLLPLCVAHIKAWKLFPIFPRAIRTCTRENESICIIYYLSVNANKKKVVKKNKKQQQPQPQQQQQQQQQQPWWVNCVSMAKNLKRA